MKNDILRENTPPMIRVFLSSTFADMENERTYFNETLVPRLNRICAERGVSFFSVDLRWGITEEEQVDGKVLPICLGEIDKCRPYFIGILGNRYGSVMEMVSEQLVGEIPWLVGREGHSITELEMLYAALDCKEENRTKNCTFYLRTEKLTESWYGKSEQDDRLTTLKRRICEDESIASAEYDSLEEFGEKVMKDILVWLDEEFPIPEKVNEVRRAWYDRELLRNYIDIPELNAFLDSYCRESERSLMFYGDGARGKTTFLTAWKPTDGKKILINCGSDDEYLYWPSIAKQIVNEINGIDSGCGYPQIDAQRLGSEFYFSTDAERDKFSETFLDWLKKLSLDEKVYVVINDLNLLEDEKGRLLAWLPSEAYGNVHFICSTNDDEMVHIVETLGWNCKEMPLFGQDSTREFAQNYLSTYGKSLSAMQMDTLLKSPVIVYPEQLRLVADFLINCGRFHNLDRFIGDISFIREITDVYRYIYEYLILEFTEREKSLVRNVLGLLRCVSMSLKEQECFALAGSLSEATTIEWARVRSVFEQFGLIKGDYWNIREEELQKFVDSIHTKEEFTIIHEMLGDYMLSCLKAEREDGGSLHIIRENTAYAKATLMHYQKCQKWEKLRDALMEHEVLFYLVKVDWHTVRVAWMMIFLYSDIDIPKALFALLDKYKEEKGEERTLYERTAGLFIDLCRDDCMERLYREVGTNQIAGSLASHVHGISRSFMQAYNRMQELKKNRQFPKLYQFVKAVISAGIECNTMEKCQLLFFKADCEAYLDRVEALETVNEYYKTALRTGYIYEISRALSMRGNILYKLGQYQETAKVQYRVKRLAMQEGDLREYLGAENALGMCLYRDGEYEKSVRTFEELMQYWQKLGNMREVSSLVLNRSNALSLGGEVAKALEGCEAFYDRISEDETLRVVSVSMLGNMGGFAMELGDYEKAEKYLLKASTEAEKIGQESTLIKARRGLIKIYEETDQFMKAVELYRKQLELFWRRQEYADLIVDLKKAAKLLLINRYDFQAKELEKEWETRFDRMEGGKSFFEQQMYRGVSDDREIERLKEKTAMAKSEGDIKKRALACRELSRAVLASDRESGLKYILDAAELYYNSDAEEEAEACLEDAFSLIFKNGIIQNKANYDRALGMTRNPSVKRIAELWMSMGAYKTMFCKFLDELVTMSTEKERLVLLCLMDVSKLIVNHCTAEQMIDLVHELPEQSGERLKSELVAALSEGAEEDMAELLKDYLSPRAEKTLAFYEKGIRFFDAMGVENTAAFAGNVALVFRRRKEKEKSIQYHDLSMRYWKKLGKTRDYLIELMNMASAFHQFGEKERALNLLRQGLKEAVDAKEERMEASIAGNLAGFLVELQDAQYHDEIMRCFAIEENYFRSANVQRDLAISLFNQLIYIRDKKDVSEWKPLLEEVGRIVRTNRFREFEQTLAKLEWLAEQK